MADVLVSEITGGVGVYARGSAGDAVAHFKKNQSEKRKEKINKIKKIDQNDHTAVKNGPKVMSFQGSNTPHLHFFKVQKYSFQGHFQEILTFVTCIPD